jgi:hypothetical protein
LISLAFGEYVVLIWKPSIVRAAQRTAPRNRAMIRAHLPRPQSPREGIRYS